METPRLCSACGKALAELKRKKLPLYGVHFLGTKAVTHRRASFAIEFPKENAFAFKAVQKQDVQAAVADALAQSCAGQAVPFAYQQAGAAPVAAAAPAPSARSPRRASAAQMPATRAFASAASGPVRATSDAGGAAASGGTRRGAGPHGPATSGCTCGGAGPRGSTASATGCCRCAAVGGRSGPLWRHGRAHARGRAPQCAGRPRALRAAASGGGSPSGGAPAGGTGNSATPGASSRSAASQPPGCHQRPIITSRSPAALSPGQPAHRPRPPGVREAPSRRPFHCGAPQTPDELRAVLQAGFGGGVTFEEVKE